MKYLENLSQELEHLYRIKTPLIWIATREEELAEKAAVHIAAKMDLSKYYYYVANTGGFHMDPITLRRSMLAQNQNLDDMFAEEGGGSQYPEMLPNINAAFSMLRDAPENVMLVIRNAEDVFTSTVTQRAVFDLCARKIHEQGAYHPLVMISPSRNVPEMLRDFTTTVELPLMNEQENFLQICQWLKKTGRMVKKEEALGAARAATGLTTLQLKHALDDSWEKTGTLSAKVINNVRIEVVKQSNVLTYVEPQKTLETVGGHNMLKQWIREAKRCMTPEAKAFGVDECQGYLAAGQPGTGKTAMAEAIADYFGVPLIIFDLSKIMGGIVGQSEQTARAAFDTIRSIGRCVVLIDEADKQFSGCDSSATISDGGTIKRVFDVVLQNLNSNTQQFYILTANDISKLPAALTRAGRLDTKWYFSFPTEAERKDILNIYFSEKGKTVSNDLLDYAARITEKFTGAEIKTAVKNIVRQAFLRNSEITQFLILDGVSQVTPVYKANPEEVEELEKYAKEHNIPSTSSENKKSAPLDAKAEKRMKQALRACSA